MVPLFNLGRRRMAAEPKWRLSAAWAFAFFKRLSRNARFARTKVLTPHTTKQKTKGHRSFGLLLRARGLLSNSVR